MATKRIIVTNAIEAEEAAKELMAIFDRIYPLKLAYAIKAKSAEREQQYQFYKCRFQQIDNQVIEVSRALTLVAEFLPMPQNFPL